MASSADSAGTPARHSELVFLGQQFAVNFMVAVAMTFVMTAVIFHGRAAVPLWGSGNLVFDLVPSTLLPTFGATMAITKITQLAIGRGVIGQHGTNLFKWLPGSNALAGLVIGLGLLAVLGAGFIGIVDRLFAQGPVPFNAIIVCKLLYALLLCLANTPIIVARAKQRYRLGGVDEFEPLSG